MCFKSLIKDLVILSNGHFGDTPRTVIEDSNGESLIISETSNTYHYHMSGLQEPFTVNKLSLQNVC